MAITEQLSSVEVASPAETATSICSSIKSLARFLIQWVNACADYYAAAAMYEQLRRLSDGELHKRGLSRDTLARDLCHSCDRTAGR
jgi:hypothetical protein